MTRFIDSRLFLLAALTLSFSAGAQAQVHQHEHADSTQAVTMDHEALMAMHERMMADSLLHQRMMADPEIRTLMAEMMGAEMDRGATHEHMAAMSSEERRAMMNQMHERMMARMEALPEGDRKALMQRMMEAHRRLMADPAVHERMIADPEMHRMMQDGMDHDGMEGMHREQAGAAPMSAGDALAAEAASRTADRFHAALTAGDRAAVEALLLREAIVLEGGQAETRGEYLGHHFQRDAAFLAAVEREPRTRRTEVAGDVAWASSTSRLTGTYEGRTIDLDSAELLVLRRDASVPDGWRVAAVHWSSGTRN